MAAPIHPLRASESPRRPRRRAALAAAVGFVLTAPTALMAFVTIGGQPHIQVSGSSRLDATFRSCPSAVESLIARADPACAIAGRQSLTTGALYLVTSVAVVLAVRAVARSPKGTRTAHERRATRGLAACATVGIVGSVALIVDLLQNPSYRFSVSMWAEVVGATLALVLTVGVLFLRRPPRRDALEDTPSASPIAG